MQLHVVKPNAQTQEILFSVVINYYFRSYYRYLLNCLEKWCRRDYLLPTDEGTNLRALLQMKI